jgi:hypothetical protein
MGDDVRVVRSLRGERAAFERQSQPFPDID